MDYEKMTKEALVSELRKLAETSRKYEVIFSACHDGIALVEIDSQKISTANPALVKNLGYKLSEIQELTLIDLVAKDDHSQAKYEFDSLIRGDLDIIRGIPCISRTGLKLSFDISGATVTMNGKGYLIASFRDITDKIKNDHYQKELQNEYFHSSKLASIGELASGIAHEINNPLSIMRGYIENLEDQIAEDPSALKESVRIIDDSITRVSNIIDGIRDYAETRSVGNREIDVHTVITETINLIRGPYNHVHIKLKSELLADNAKVFGNEGKVKHILMNILSNAKEAMLGRTGTINVETVNVLDSIVVKISDCGTGIDPNEISKLCDAFYTTKDPGQGMGLGLSITHSILREMKGIIDIESKEGEGTSVHVLLPLVIKEKKIEPKSKFDKISGKILIVDDEETIRKIMMLHMEKFGLEVHEASDGKQALEMIKKEYENNSEYMFVVTDFNMPGMFGNELIEAAQSLGATNTKFIIASATIFGEYTKDQRQKILKIADANIKKPFTRNDIYKILKSFY